MALRNHNPMLGAQDIDSKWRHIKYDYTSGNLDYIGFSLTHKASTSSGNLWWIWKFVWNATPNVIGREGYLVGNWDDRASLGWE